MLEPTGTSVSPYPLNRTIAICAFPSLGPLARRRWWWKGARLGVRGLDALGMLHRSLDGLERLPLDGLGDGSVHAATGEVLRRGVEVFDLQLDPARVLARRGGLE